MTGGHKGNEKCDAKAALVFIIGLAAGTGCTIASKALFQVVALGKTGEPEPFNPPLFQTWVMFVGMTFALPAHFYSEHRRRAMATPEELKAIEAEPKVTAHTYMLLAIPSVFDLIATCLMVFGLLHINASVWMLLRGGGIVFVALMKNYVLKDKLKPSMWAGVGIIGIAVVLVGMSSGVGAKSEDADGEDDGSAVMEAVFGVLITLAGTFVQSVQYTYEEKVMSGDISAPPWLLIGLEGLTGTLLSTFVLYPICWAIPGNDHGSFEDPVNTFTKLANSPPAMAFAITFCVLVFVLNSFSVLVTYMMSSVWHAILDNFRPITIWIVELMIFYAFTEGSYGEAWTEGSWLQLGGMIILLFGTAVYNGSIQLPGIPTDDLIGKSSMMASPALSRSPLITLNQSTPPLNTSGASPYVSRVRLDADPMSRGGRDLEKPFLS